MRVHATPFLVEQFQVMLPSNDTKEMFKDKSTKNVCNIMYLSLSLSETLEMVLCQRSSVCNLH
jgi:hypothetical protein